MGSNHGVEGFREFSHARSINTQPKIDIAKLGGFKPPYGAQGGEGDDEVARFGST